MTPATCRAAVFSGPGRELSLVQFPVPSPAPGEVLVRIKCCTICGSDIHTYLGTRDEPTPTILGHEAIGVVEQIGAETVLCTDGSQLMPGDRVTWSVAVSCFECDRCQAGLPQKCRTLRKYGHERAEGRESLSGGLAEYILLRRGSSILKLGNAMADEVACPSNCATATIAACFRHAGDVAQKCVLIFGAGMLGLTASALAAERSASLIAIVDVEKSRLDRAAMFGATYGILADPDQAVVRQRLMANCRTDCFDTVFELSGAKTAIEQAFACTDIGARVVLAGSVMPSPYIPLNPEMVVRRCLSIQGVHNYTPQDLQSAIQFLTESHERYPFDKLVARSFSLDQINEAMLFAVQHRPVRIAIVP